MSNERILIVGHDLTLAEDIQNKLESAGFRIAGIATSLETAIQQAVETKPDLVLIDTVLEGGSDGIEATRQIKALFDIPIVYLTAHSDPETLQRVRSTAPAGFILKPLAEGELEITIEMALYKHTMEKKLQESEARYRAIIENANAGYFRIDTNGQFQEVNQAWLRMHGYEHPVESQPGVGSTFYFTLPAT
jgi:two-component system cell cycle sensor histidine kinase/response regulator CckA